MKLLVWQLGFCLALFGSVVCMDIKEEDTVENTVDTDKVVEALNSLSLEEKSCSTSKEDTDKNIADTPEITKQVGKSCNTCYEKNKDLFRCSRCKEALYCSKECQQIDWLKRHRAGCRPHKGTDTKEETVRNTLDTHATTEQEEKSCFICKEKNKALFKCPRYKDAFYCSKECQQIAKECQMFKADQRPANSSSSSSSQSSGNKKLKANPPEYRSYGGEFEGGGGGGCGGPWPY